MDYTTRKSLVYKTKVEYGDYTINHIEGCSHGCNYPCYAMLMAKRFGRIKNYDEWITPKLVSNTLELLDSELPKLKDRIDNIHLCFMTDPFMYGKAEIIEMSIKAIKKINSYGVKCTVLTKGILPIELSTLDKLNIYGITLISLDEDFRKKMEPFSAPYLARINRLKELKDKGYSTWVSIEPYPTPNIIEQDISLILEKIEFVDKIIFGRLNYNKKVADYEDEKLFFNGTAKKVISFCKKNKIKYHIKNGTITKKANV
jgi:DNA repair photolyase